MNKAHILWVVAILLSIGLIIGYRIWQESRPGEYDALASCIKDSGTTFYGAFWCPHCQAQKALFGRSARLLPYVECSLPSGQGQTQACIDKEVKTYPTWVFPDGSIVTGEQSLATLAQASGCPIP